MPAHMNIHLRVLCNIYVSTVEWLIKSLINDVTSAESSDKGLFNICMVLKWRIIKSSVIVNYPHVAFLGVYIH